MMDSSGKDRWNVVESFQRLNEASSSLNGSILLNNLIGADVNNGEKSSKPCNQRRQTPDKLLQINAFKFRLEAGNAATAID